eukprot:TRINITY_DN543_c0_g1_i2.p1 TRINITY_DN543_c0_g1~~TRINITY_DN543_c0_g1_i2.p1  ORF type:complete len:255 (-),score=68.55 TRINITY_DN543_c0_g1_i2:115-843(-)
MDKKITAYVQRVLVAEGSSPVSPKDEEGFKSLLQSESLSPSQVTWVRETIFNVSKEAVKSVDPTLVLSKTQSLIGVFERSLLQPVPKYHTALFFPDDETSFKKFYKVMESPKKSLDICVFTITDDRIANIIIAAKNRGVAVRVITDDEKAEDLGADIQTLRDNGIPVRIDHTSAHMHHKFAIIDNEVLINGSFNWTRSASTKNNENVTILDDVALIASFRREFERLWKFFGDEKITGEADSV